MSPNNDAGAESYPVAPAPDRQLELISRGRQLLAEARTIEDVKEIRDQAEAIRLYLRQHDDAGEAMRDAAELKLRAERQLGEMLARTVRPGNPQLLHDATIGGLPEGVNRIDSHRWQKAASVPEEDFEAYLGWCRENGEAPTSAGVRRLAQELERKKAREEARASGPDIPAVVSGDRWRVEQADCLDFLRRQAPGSIDLIFGSPPYEDARLYLENGEDLGVARDTDAWVTWMVEVFKASLSCCKGLVAFVVAGRTRGYAWTASPALLMAALRAEGITLRCPPIYHRVGIPGSGGPDWLRHDYEFVVCATNGGPLPWSNNTAMGEPPKWEPGGNPSHRLEDGRRANDTGYASMADRENVGPHRARQRAGRVYCPPERANPGNVIDCVVGGGAMGDDLCHENEAPFPESLAEFFVRSFCPPAGVVCDPFAGSGTTIAVAVANGRVGIGCDLRASQVDLVRRRLAGVTPPLFGEV